MSDKRPLSESHGSLASLRDVFSRLGFDVGTDSIKYTSAQKMNPKRGRKRQVGEKLHSVTTINRWQLTETEIVDLSLSLDMGLFQENLKESVTRFFGTKAEAEIHLSHDGVIDLVIFVTQPGTKTNERGYLNLPREDDLPIGCFGFKLKIASCSDGLNIQMQNVFGLGYLPTDFLLSVEEWLFSSFGVEGIAQNGWKRAHFSEFIIHIDSLVLSAVGAKDTERRQAAEFLKKWRERNTTRQDYRLEWEFEDSSLHLSALHPGERKPVQPISVATLEIREMVRQNDQLENAFISGQWNTVAEILGSENNTEKNNYLELRAALMLIMVNFPNKYRNLVDIMKRSGDSMESLSAKLRVSDNSAERLAMLSKLTTSVLEKFEFAEGSRGIGLVFSEYLGDLWSYEDVEVAVECYDRALEMDKNSGRLLRKKKNLFSTTNRYEKAIDVLDILITVEPRKVEISKLMIEKGGYLLSLGLTSDAVAAGELAVSNDRLSPKAALFLANALRLGGQFAESVQSLDDLLCIDNGLLSARQKSELNTVIGKTWLNDLNSPEIAASRLKIAIELDPESELAHRLLADCLERSGRFEEQVKILEKYLLIVEKMDDEDAISWAQDKITTQSREIKELSSNQRLNNLKRILNKERINFSQVALLMDAHRSADDWHIITATLSQRVTEIQSLDERGMIYERLGKGAMHYLNAHELSDHFLLKAWETGYVSEEVFQSNFARLSKISDTLALAKLCEVWIEKDLRNRLLLLRDCIDREIPINASTLDRWIVEATVINPENVDIAIRRLQQLIRIDNCVEIVKLWTALVDSGLGFIRRRRVFNYIKEYLFEKGLFSVLFDAYLAFSQKSDDQVETLKEAIDILHGKIEDSEFGVIIRQCLLASYLPSIPHEQVVSLLSNYPSELKKYYLIKAGANSNSREALADIVSAMNIQYPSDQHSVELSIDRMIQALIVAPEQSEWFGIENIKAMVYSPRHTKIFINYLSWWIPKIESTEKIQGTNILLDLLKVDKRSPDESLQILDEIINAGYDNILNDRIAAILMEASRANRSYRIKLIIESNKPSKDSILETASNLCPTEFGESLTDIFKLMQQFKYNSIEKLNFYIDTKIYSHPESGRMLDRIVRDYLLASVAESDEEFRFWFCNQSFSHLTRGMISGIFNLKNSYSIDAEDTLLNFTTCIFEVCEDWDLMQQASIWILHQLKNVKNVDVIKKIFLSLNPTVLTHPIESIQSYLISKQIGDLMRARFFAAQIHQALESGLDSLSANVRDYYPFESLQLILLEVEDFYRKSTSTNDENSECRNNEPDALLEETSLNFSDDPGSVSYQPNDLKAIGGKIESEAETVVLYSSGETTSVARIDKHETVIQSDVATTAISDFEKLNATEVTIKENDSALQWRDFIKENRVTNGHFALIQNAEVLNLLEKHIALQAVAIAMGNMNSLSGWKWPVWRERSKMQYPLAMEGRFPEHAVSSSLIAPLANFLKEIYPMVVMNLWEKCSLGGLAKSSGLSEDQLIAKLLPIDWKNHFLIDSGVGLLSDRFEAKAYKVYQFVGIKDKIWLDAGRRWIIIDLEYFKTMPPSVLFFAFLSKHWEVMSRFQVYLDSNPTYEAFPVVKIIYEYFLEEFGFSYENSNMKVGLAERPVLSIPRQELDRQSEYVDREKLKTIMNDLSALSESDFLNQQFVMRCHIHRLCLAESLDLIGVLEFITKRNMIDSAPKSLIELVGQSKYIQPIMKFMLQMDFVTK